MITGTIYANAITPLAGDLTVLDEEWTLEGVQEALQKGELEMVATYTDQFDIFAEGGGVIATVTEATFDGDNSFFGDIEITDD